MDEPQLFWGQNWPCSTKLSLCCWIDNNEPFFSTTESNITRMLTKFISIPVNACKAGSQSIDCFRLGTINMIVVETAINDEPVEKRGCMNFPTSMWYDPDGQYQPSFAKAIRVVNRTVAPTRKKFTVLFSFTMGVSKFEFNQPQQEISSHACLSSGMVPYDQVCSGSPTLYSQSTQSSTYTQQTLAKVVSSGNSIYSFETVDTLLDKIVCTEMAYGHRNVGFVFYDSEFAAGDVSCDGHPGTFARMRFVKKHFEDLMQGVAPPAFDYTKCIL
ncbi:uncharacterized protein LOC135388036 [Ornithodoros turicata]|uniref:uncharacterized protein LOC135388036 n=1 Tax=Ornithodoros turicata TaxID=34597 RepID=UPI003138B59E